MDIVVVGHVDHGKSTIVGRLMADTGSLPEGKLEQVKAHCEMNSRPFEYAFLLDAMKDEVSQGITIDAARVFFKTKVRPYTIIDAPGHIEFLKNMVTGASRAQAALLVIDGNEGVQENSRRHGYILSMLGIKQIAVVVNKMDLLKFEQKAFEAVKAEYGHFLEKLGVKPFCYIPLAGLLGENIVTKSKQMPWYSGSSIIETLDSFEEEQPLVKKAFRMPVQDVYKFTRNGDDRRIVAGTVDSGTLKVGDQVVFYPSGKSSKVKSIEVFSAPAKTTAEAKQATGFTLQEQIYVSRGEIATVKGQSAPEVGTRLRVNLFWLGKEPMVPKKPYLIKLGTTKVEARLTEVIRVMNTSSLDAEEKAEQITTNSVAECVLTLSLPIAADTASEFADTGRFVIVDQFDICGGGNVREFLTDDQYALRNSTILRNTMWELSMIPPETRSERFGQKSLLVLVTSSAEVERKGIAKKLEKDLFENGRVTYYFGFRSSLYGVSADIRAKENGIEEAMRRFSEQVNVLMDAGVLVIATVAELTREDLAIFQTAIGPDKIEVVWIGEAVTTNLNPDLKTGGANENEAVRLIKHHLQDRGIVFKAR